mmetsp:Transcript_35189/g.113351  ORF Transcript_35189/g.113351 Transcript_35189/m.113351 type:complete len:138 (+) Transcript_35189:667-1080(+)
MEAITEEAAALEEEEEAATLQLTCELGVRRTVQQIRSRSTAAVTRDAERIPRCAVVVPWPPPNSECADAWACNGYTCPQNDGVSQESGGDGLVLAGAASLEIRAETVPPGVLTPSVRPASAIPLPFGLLGCRFAQCG